MTARTNVFQDFLNQNHIRVLPWPALSPDLSPIEHLLDELGRHVRHRQIPPETRNINKISQHHYQNKSWTERNCHAVWRFAELNYVCDHLLQQRQLRISDA
jgi:hypothetical protein